MRYGGLFEGIGGFALAAREIGWTPVWSNEIDPFCCKVLEKNFDHKIINDDIRNIGENNLEPVDIITGGFPCQPFSIAGKQQGTNDNRHLWPERLRLIRELRPRYVVGENVPGLLSIERGMVFEDVCTSLEIEGYEVQSVIIPACAIGAVHRRDRVWIIANNESVECSNGKIEESREYQGYESDRGLRCKKTFTNNKLESDENLHKGRGGSERLDMEQNVLDEARWEQSANATLPCDKYAPNPNSLRQSRQGKSRRSSNTKEKREGEEYRTFNDLLRITEPPVRGANDGIRSRMDRYRLKALGNAIVPQVAYEIFKVINELES